MFIWHFLVAMLIALLLTAVFGGLLGGHRRGGALIFFFVVLLFGTWAGGLWLTPIGGPLWGGASWISFIFVGLFFALILTAALPPQRKRNKPDTGASETEPASLVVFGIFFWILIVALGVAIVGRYVTL